MPSFSESRLEFHFAEDWQVIKYDDEAAYRKMTGLMPGMKGIDFLALHDDMLYFIEVKNFRNYPTEEDTRLSSNALVYQVAQKVRDSLAGMIGAYRNAQDPMRWERFANHAVVRERPVRVVLWLKHHFSTAENKVQQSVLLNQLKKALAWLTPHVWVADEATNPFLERGLRVSHPKE